MTRWSLFLQTLSLLHHFLGLYSMLPFMVPDLESTPAPEATTELLGVIPVPAVSEAETNHSGEVAHEAEGATPGRDGQPTTL